MARATLLPDDLLRELHDAVIAIGLQRDDLVGHLDRRLVAGFRKASSPGGQVWSDLGSLNEIRELTDGSVPLRTWLETASHLAEPRSEAAVFRKALTALDAAAPGTAQVSAAAKAPPHQAAPAVASTTASGSRTTSTPSGSAMQTADILIVTVLPEEYEAVRSQLTDARPAQGTPDAPNTHAWRLGTIAREGGGTYRVALALVGGAGNVNASQALAMSVARWQPRYALLVGIAGGLAAAGCAVGDVVVSTEVYGYEYGKLDGGFQARPNWIYQVDPGLRASAQGFAVANPDWAQSTATPRPKVLFGPVAAGDKVVDDPSDPMFAAVLRLWPKLHAVEMEGAGAAAAIEHLRAAGTRVGFLIVRGISDRPRPPGERDGESAQTGERDANKQRACEAAARFVARWIATEWPVAPSEAADPSLARRA